MLKTLKYTIIVFALKGNYLNGQLFFQKLTNEKQELFIYPYNKAFLEKQKLRESTPNLQTYSKGNIKRLFFRQKQNDTSRNWDPNKGEDWQKQ